MSRKSLPTSIRAAIWRAHEKRCIYCTELLSFADLDVDHIIPSHLKDKPKKLFDILYNYGLNKNFDIDSLSNLVPSHRSCNLQKTGQVLPKNRALHFLSIAEEKSSKALKIELEIKRQAEIDKFTILVQVALNDGKISHNEVASLLSQYTKSRDSFKVLAELPFADANLRGFISSTDVDLLYDRPILPRLHGLEKLDMAKGYDGEENRSVQTCREWIEAIREGYFAKTTYDIKEETFFKRVYALIIALAQAEEPKASFISKEYVSVANFNLLPVTILPVLTNDVELKNFVKHGISMNDLVDEGKVRIVSASPLSLKLYYGGMGLALNEILRSDLNGDGFEEILVGTYEWALQGTLGYGSVLALTRRSKDAPFLLANDVELGIK